MNRTSAEPARTTAYSPDIGWRVVWQRLGMDLTFKQIAQRLQIAVGTAHRIFKRCLWILEMFQPLLKREFPGIVVESSTNNIIMNFSPCV